SVWGAPQEQGPPTASCEVVENHGRETRRREIILPLDGTRAEAALTLEHRKKGLLWYSTYWVDYSAVYRFRNTTDTGLAGASVCVFPRSRQSTMACSWS